jgi:polysaccharide export outer membrane protein
MTLELSAHPRRLRAAVSMMALAALTASAAAAPPQEQGPAARPPGAAAVAPAEKIPAAPAPGTYVIGPEDVLDIQFWREKDISGEVVVRPDGKITTLLLNDVQAAGLTPEQLRVRLTEEAAKLLENPIATVIVKQINSRRAYITGEIEKPGPYNVITPTTVLQLISMAGGLKEYADRDSIVIMRTENGRQLRYGFDYDKVVTGRALTQNIELKPGDTVVVR